MRRIRILPKRLSSTRVHLVILALCAGAMTFVGYKQTSNTRTSNSALVLREGRGESSRSLHTTGQGHKPMTRPPSQPHTFLVLDSGDSGASTLKTLEPYLAPYRQYPEAVAISLVTGPAASALAAQFSIDASSLPAVVYLAPVWQNGVSFKQANIFSLGEGAAGLPGFTNWAKSVARMTLLLMNDWEGNTVCFYFVTEDDKEVEVGCTQAQVELWQEVSLLDTFTARNMTGRTILSQHVALFSGIFAVHPPGFCNYLVDRTCEAAKLPHPTDEGILNHRKVNEQRRAAELKEQPPKTKQFTHVGFEKRRAPVELFQLLNGYLNSTWENVIRETWLPDDTFTNHDDAPSMKMTLPRMGTLKARMTNIVQDLLEKWIGNIPLEPTATYGIRIYSTNSTLAMHCDRPDTHLVSAIINVNQDVTEPWPLQIFDHAGTEHSVNMEVGDMVMYEGASCGHGRVQPLKGRYYANVFVHFKPRK